jgi:transposase
LPGICYAPNRARPGIGENLGLTILYEIGNIERFPTVKDFLSYCRLVKGTVATAGKIKGLRGTFLHAALIPGH